MSVKDFSFELITQDDKARLGKIFTSRGVIDTPAFMPVGTQGTVKGIFPDDILKTKTQIILGNTYHLLLRPGIEVLNKFNGLHNFNILNFNKNTINFLPFKFIPVTIDNKLNTMKDIILKYVIFYNIGNFSTPIKLFNIS